MPAPASSPHHPRHHPHTSPTRSTPPQGSQSRVVRLGSVPGAKAKYLGLLGLGKAAKAGVVAEWGPSTYQVMMMTLGRGGMGAQQEG